MRAAPFLLIAAVLLPPMGSGPLAAQQLMTAGAEQELARGQVLTRVSAAVFGPEGLLAVAQPLDSRVLLFDLLRPEKAIAVMGREGAGPGEFARLGNIGWIGDTLWATDGTRPRVEYFLLDGKRLTSRTFDPVLQVRRFTRYPGPTLVLRGGATLFSPAVAVGPTGLPPEVKDESLPVLLVRPGVAAVTSVAHLQLFRSVVALDGDRGSGIVAQPFSTVDLVRSGGDGSKVVVIEQNASGTSGAAAWVRVLNPTGATLFRRELDVPRFQVSNGEWDSVMTAWSSGPLGKEMWSSSSQARSDMRAVTPRPKYHPAVAAAIVGRDGSIWLRHSRDTKGKATWTVLSPLGDKIGTIELDAALRVLDATPASVVAARLDNDGVEHLVLIPVASGR